MVKNPEGAISSSKRAALKTSSRTASALTGAKLGQDAKVVSSKGDVAKASSGKATTLEAASTKHCSQSVAAKHEKRGDAKSAANKCASARTWSRFKVKDPKKARYSEKQRVAFLLRKVQLQQLTKEELPKELTESILQS